MKEDCETPAERIYVELQPLSREETLRLFNSGDQGKIAYALWSTAQFCDWKLGQDWALHFLESPDDFVINTSVNVLEFICCFDERLEYSNVLRALRRRAMSDEIAADTASYIMSMLRSIVAHRQSHRRFAKKRRQCPDGDWTDRRLGRAGRRGQRRVFRRFRRRPRSRA